MVGGVSLWSSHENACSNGQSAIVQTHILATLEFFFYIYLSKRQDRADSQLGICGPC